MTARSTARRSTQLRSLLSSLLVSGITLGIVGVSSPRSVSADGDTPPENCTVHFDGEAADGRWATPTNWSTDQLPTADDVACVVDAVVTVDTPVEVRQLHGNGTVVLAGGLLTAYQTSNIVNVDVRDGTLYVGERLSPHSFVQQGGVVAGEGVLAVGGVFTWTGGTQSDEDGLTHVDAEAAATIAPILDLTWSGRQLQIDGTTSIVGPGDVHFGTSGVYLNAVEFGGGEVAVTGASVTIAGGSVDTAVVLPTGQEIRGSWTVGTGASLGLVGGSISGTVELDGDAELDILAAPPESGGTSLTASGQVVTIGSDGSDGSSGVVVDPGATFTVGGTIAVETLENNGSTSLMSSALADRVTNDGWLEIGPDATFTVAEMSIDAGEVSVAEGGSIRTGAHPLILQGGVLVLDGFIDGSVEQLAGELWTGDAGGAAILGSYLQTGGALGVSVGTNSHPPLVVAGDVGLSGTLHVASENPLHTTEPLVTGGSVSGAFTAVDHDEWLCPEVVFEADQVILDAVYCPTIPTVEASEGNGLTTFSVSIDAPVDEPYEVAYHTVDGSAADGTDYVGTTGTAVIPAGNTSVGVEVAILDDTVVENDEDFGLVVVGPNDTAVAIGTATVVDDDDRVGLDDHFRIDDLGSMGSGLYPTGINSKGVVGYGSWDADNGFSWVWSFAARQIGFVSGFETSSVFDVAENGRILGPVAIREVGGVLTPLARPSGWSFQAAAMNDSGVVAGVAYPTQQTSALVRWGVDGTPEVLDAPTARSYRVEAISASGTIVGSVLLEGATISEAFRFGDDGFEILDRMPGSGAVASGINDAGVTVGWSGQRAVMWDTAGTMIDLGPGFANEINNDDVIVGATRDLTGTSPRNIAAIFYGGNVFEIGDYVPDDSGYVFEDAVEINDDGVIAATGTYNGAKRTVVLTPFDCFVCVTTRFDEALVDAPGEYVPVDGATTDGNPVRLEVELTNTANSRVPVELWVVDTLTDEPLHEEPYILSLAGGGGRESVTFDIDTTGMAWSNGTPADPRRYEVVVTNADDEIELATDVASLTVHPRPMVLVHGLWSDEITWSNYQAFAQNAHPQWRAYAVDTMDTSSFVPNTIAENAAEVDAFVDQLRSTQNVWSVDLVGHSMGGLISRQYIQDLMPTNVLPTAPGQEVPAVNRLVMLGTPNGGSPCVLMAPLPATVELRPDMVALFNTRVIDRRGVPFSVAAGDHLPFTCQAPLAGDDVVPLASAQLGIDDVVEFEGMAHTSMTGSQELFEQFVVPRLNGTSIGVAVESRAATLDAMSADPDVETTTGQALLVDTTAIDAGATDGIGLTVPADADTVGVTVAARGVVHAELVDPSGVVRASIDPVPGEYPSFRSMTADARAGRWILRIINTGAEEASVSVGVFAVGAAEVLDVTAEESRPGEVQLRANLDRPAADRPSTLVGEFRDGDGRVYSVDLRDDGSNGDDAADDGTYGGVVRPLSAGPGVVTLNVVQPGFMRSATAGVIVGDVADEPDDPDGPDGPDSPNRAPVADAQAVNAERDTATPILLTGTDPDNDGVVVTEVGSPSNGTISGTVPNVVYTPRAGYVGPDSFTFVVSDGELSSAPATVSIEVGGPAAVTITFDPSSPVSAGSGEEVQLRARVVNSKGQSVAGLPVTFELGGREWTSTTSSSGYAGFITVLDLGPGLYELRMTTPATDDYRTGVAVQPFTVTPNQAPTVLAGEVIGTEAGYRTRVRFGTSDPERDIVSAEWDMDGDGVVDATTGPPEDFGARRVWVDHVYAEAYEGPVTVTVIDSAGNRSSGSVVVDIAPYRPLGSLEMLTVEDRAVWAIGMDDGARRVLHRAVVPGSVPTRYRLEVLDRDTGESEVVSVGVDGTLLDAEIGVLSGNGGVVAFLSVVPGASAAQVLVRDLATGTTTIVSVDVRGALGTGRSVPIALSADGDRLLFSSEAANLGPLSCPGCDANYVWDRTDGSLTLVSLDPGGVSVEADERQGDISADGTTVAMELRIGGQDRIVVRDLRSGVSTLASVSVDGLPSRGEAPKLNADGSVVVFQSIAADLFPGDTNGFTDVVVRDLAAGTNRPVSSMLVPANGSSANADISGDGSRVVFDSIADPSTGQRQAVRGVHVADLATDTVTTISREPRLGMAADDNSSVMARPGWITCDGRYALFMSEASNLVPGDVSDELDSFVEDTGVSRPCGAGANTPPEVAVGAPAAIVEGDTAALVATATDADGDVLTYTWTTDHGTITGTGTDAALGDLDGPATATVTLTVSDGVHDVRVASAITILNAAPTVEFVSPAIGTPVPLGATVVLDTTVGDAAGPADPVSCVAAWGDGSTSVGCDGSHVYTTAGSFTIAVTAVDDDGASTTVTRTVAVESPPTPECRFEGFFAPVDNLPTVNTVTAGSNVPLKFRYCSDGRLAIFANGSPTSSAHPCGVGLVDNLEETASPGASTLRFDAGSGRYHYNWKTEKAWKGQCRSLTFRLIDGTVVTAEFKFR